MATQHKTEIQGFEYETQLSSARRIELFLNSLKDTKKAANDAGLSESFLNGMATIEKLATCWFEDEIRVMKVLQN